MASKKKSNQKKTTPIPEAVPAVEVSAATAPDAAVIPPAAPSGPMPKWEKWTVPLLILAFFIGTCLTAATTIKVMAMTMMIAAVISCIVRFSAVRERLSLPLLVAAVWLLCNGASTFYAVSGKFALKEFLKLMVGFCLILLILAWSRKGRDTGRAAASILSGGTAIASLVSIDMISTHWISGLVLGFLEDISTDFLYAATHALEVGSRINSLYENPNSFAGIAGLGVLLSLELAVTARREGERPFHLVCLFINALAFLLVFSMGASGVLMVAFLVLLLLERPSRKSALFALMLETLVMALACTFPIFLTSFQSADAFQPIPLLCAVVGAAALCVVDRFVGMKFTGKTGGKALTVAIAAVLALLAIFAAAALNLTGPATLSAGEGLRRSAYPEAGTYTLELVTSGDVTVTIESQNQQDTMMHTETVLYSGPAQGAVFTVPEGSLVTYFNFYANENLTLSEANVVGENGSTSLKLHYKVLPGFIANRLQGLFANENAIQRTVFFSDGMKLFRRSPVFGLGLGTYESSIQSVQSFHYETKYAHNHYVETLVSTGVVGLILFVGMLLCCAWALVKSLRRGEEAAPMAPALFAALLFMAGHAAVEVIFSFNFYLPMALGVIGLICLCCGDELPLLREKEEAGSWVTLIICVLIVAYAILLGLNMHARKVATNNTKGNGFASLSSAAEMDFFEKNDYLLSYVVSAQKLSRKKYPDILEKADRYAAQLYKADSNTICLYLADYYFETDQPDLAISALVKHVNYVSSNSETWIDALDTLSVYYEDFPEACQRGTEEIAALLQTWNEENMGSIQLEERNLAFIEIVTG